MGRQRGGNDRHRWEQGRRKKLTEALRWHLAWGKNLDWLTKLAEQTGETPQALDDRPQVSDHLQFVWHAYAVVRTDRSVSWSMVAGMGGSASIPNRGAIPFSSIDRFAERYGIHDIDEFDRFVFLIREMDEAERSFKTG